MSDRPGGDQLLALGAGRAQEVDLEIQGGKSGAGWGDRLYRRPAGALCQQGNQALRTPPGAVFGSLTVRD